MYPSFPTLGCSVHGGGPPCLPFPLPLVLCSRLPRESFFVHFPECHSGEPLSLSSLLIYYPFSLDSWDLCALRKENQSPSFRAVPCNSVVTPYPRAPNVLFWAQLLLNQVVYGVFFLINNSCCFRCSVRSYIVPFFSIPSQFLFWVANAPAHFSNPNQKHPRIDDNWQLYWRQLSLTNPCAPNVLFWAQLLLNQVVYVVVNHIPF